MESCLLYNSCDPTALYLPLQALPPGANVCDLPIEDWNLPSDRYSESDRLDHYLVEERTKRRTTSWPLSTLPLESLTSQLAANQFQRDGQTSLLPTSPFESDECLEKSATLPLLTAEPSESITGSEVIYESSPTSTSVDERLTEWDYHDYTAAFDFSKPLLSPIKFTPPPESKVQDLVSLRSSQSGNTSSTYLYYPPKNPADKPSPASDFSRDIPRRQLFYGEPLHTLKSKSLHRTTASNELRRRAGWQGKDDDLGSRSQGTLKASTRRPWFSEPPRSKPWLWLDLVEEGEVIEEAHATTVMTSPVKPQIISIPLRRATTTTPPSTPSIQRRQTIPNIFPATPPDTPACSIGLSIDTHEACQRERERLAFEKIKARPTWTAVPPKVIISTPESPQTLLDMLPASTLKARPDTPRPFQTPMPQLSELTIWILTELEHSLSSHEVEKLRLDSPVIQQLRLPSTQRRVPRSSPPTLPLSRFSTYQPLSSHPPSIPVQTSNAPSPNSLSAPLPALRTIFPCAPFPLLDTLQATIVALHHVSSIYLPSPSRSPSHSPPPFTHSPSPSPSQNTPLQSPDISYIPSKARAMLGLQPTTTPRPTLPSSWLRPQVLSWEERVEELEVGLGKEVGRLVGQCMAGDGRGGSVEVVGPLVKALGVVVRLSEGVR